jgi:DNA-binding beta-propeller fold protein YncE
MTNPITTPPADLGATVSPDHRDGDVAIAAAGTKMSKKRKSQIGALLIALVILALLFAWYLMNRKPLSELPGLSSTNLPHYELSIYGTANPIAVAVTPTGDRIYVTESNGPRLVHVYDNAGKQVGTLNPPKSTGPSHIPDYVAINPTSQDVYVSDRATSKIYIYDAAGTYLRAFAPKGKPLGAWQPLGLAFGPDGSLYATDVQGTGKAHRVVAFSPDGTFVGTLSQPGTLSFPNGIAVDGHGNVDVADSNNGRLLVVNMAGKTLGTISHGVGEGDLGLPRGVALDGSGRLFVVDSSDHMVRVYDTTSSTVATPTFIGSFGNEGQQDGTFEYPNGVATDTRAHIYVTDQGNNRVQVWGY